jgi:group I intron endonuclease
MNTEEFGFIYITTNLINSKKYIGQKRFKTNRGTYSKWKSYLGSGKLIKRAIKKYGKEAFKREIIDIAYSEYELNEKEIYWIEKFDAINNKEFYNIAEGGYGNPMAGKSEEELIAWRYKLSQKVCSEEHKQAISEKVSGSKHPLYGKERTNETKEKISKKLKGTKQPEELRQRRSELVKGKGNPMYGKKQSEETRRKISEAMKRRKQNVAK